MLAQAVPVLRCPSNPGVTVSAGSSPGVTVPKQSRCYGVSRHRSLLLGAAMQYTAPDLAELQRAAQTATAKTKKGLGKASGSGTAQGAASGSGIRTGYTSTQNVVSSCTARGKIAMKHFLHSDTGHIGGEGLNSGMEHRGKGDSGSCTGHAGKGLNTGSEHTGGLGENSGAEDIGGKGLNSGMEHIGGKGEHGRGQGRLGLWHGAHGQRLELYHGGARDLRRGLGIWHGGRRRGATA